MKQIGLSTSNTGIIYGVMPFIGFLVRPLIGSVADKLRKHKLVLALCCVLTGLFYVLLLFVPYKQVVYTQVQTKILCNQFDTFIHDCHHVNTSSAMPSCPLTFSEYTVMLLTKGKGNDKLNVGIINQVNSSSAPYNTVKSSDDQTSCDVSCTYLHKSMESVTMCFTNIGKSYNNSCTRNSTTVRKMTDLVLTLPNISSNVRKGEGQEIEDFICHDLDLNSFVHKKQGHDQMLCSQEVELDCTLKCSQINNDCTVTKKVHMDDTFWMFFLFFLLGNISFSPIISITDAMAYDILGDKRSQWGKQRLWGTIGFAMFAVTSTFIMDRISKNSLDINFSVSFYIFGGLWVLTALCAYFLQASEDIVCSSFLKDAFKLLSYGKFVVFMLTILCFGIFNGAIETFLYWFLQDKLEGYFNIIPGLCVLATCVAETPILFFSGYIIKKLGHLKCLCLVFIAYCLRFLLYSFLTNAWQALPIELLHGITFGLMWATSTSYGSIITPQGMSATVQGLIGGIHFGFGNVTCLFTAVHFLWT